MAPSRRRLLPFAAPVLLLLVAVAADAKPSGKSRLASGFLDAHNAARRAVGVAALRWDDRLASYAARYAAERGRSDCALAHSRGPYGENLFRGSGGVGGWSPADVVAAWVSRERALYDPASNTCRGGAGAGAGGHDACGHYTQVVWRRTTAVGCAIAPCSGGRGTNQFLGQQNAARMAMGLPPLVWDDRVAGYARWYAESRRGDCALVHSSGPYGENLFWGSGTGWSPAQAVGAWLAEQPRYNYWSNSCYGGMCGHYTQIMWRATRRVGCAMVTSCNTANNQ
uniref:SCP domain-containing protein n=1 Tax=Leersia perrieri TaxID=77586 RepID=A0A0D9VLY4_9ORYZ